MSRTRKKKAGTLAWWSDSQRLEAVTTWLAIGNMRLVSATLNIPYDTLARWKRQPWWKEAELEIQTESNIKLDSKLSKIVDKSLNQLIDRVENGDFVFNQKTGKLIRKPVNARDVNKISADMIDRRELLKSKKNQEQTQDDIATYLKKLGDEFKRFAKAKEIPAIQTTYEVKDGQPS